MQKVNIQKEALEAISEQIKLLHYKVIQPNQHVQQIRRLGEALARLELTYDLLNSHIWIKAE